MRALIAALLLVSAVARADSDEDFARHVERGRADFAAGRYSVALDELEAARRIRSLPALDLNLALCLDRLGRGVEALAAYQRYVDSVPTPEDAEQVRARIRALGERLAAAPPVAASPAPVVAAPAVAAPVVAAPVAAAAPPPRRRAALAVAISIGVALVAAIAVGVGVGLRPTEEPTSATFGVHRATP